MSLIHWFPLNGDIKDYGVDRFTIGNTPSFNDNGKIGKCATNSSLGVGRTYLTNQYLPLTKTSPISIFAWVYMNAYTQTDTTSALNGLVSNHNHSSNSNKGSGFGLNLWNSGSSFKVAVSTASTNERTWTTYCGNTAFYIGAWHHVGFTYDGSRINFYLDGNYDGGVDFTTSYDSNNQIGIFCWSTGYAQYIGDYQLNDVRIYNHALSKKEIKEISKGLVVHYNFEETPRPNLIRGNYQVATTKNGNTTSGSLIYNLPSNLNSLIGKTLVFSYDLKCVGTRKNETGSWQNDRYGVHGAIGYVASQGSSETTAFPFAEWLNPKNTEKRVSMYYAIPSTWYSINWISFAAQPFNMPSSDNNETWYIKNLKLEILSSSSDQPTPYSNENEEEKVYDNSGNNFNGTINGNLVISNDTTIGNHSMKFASDSYIDIPTLPEFKQMTVSFWTKIPTATSGYRSLFNQKSNPTGSLWLSLNTESYGLWSYMASSPSYSGAGGFIDANKWYFCTFVFDNGYANWYQNGVLLGRNVYYPNKLAIPSTHFCLGDSYGGSSWSGTPFDGWIADFKIYATALSANDIKSEYQRKASLDNQGNLYTGMFKENGSFLNTKVNKNNSITSDNFAENIILDDGSVWVPIVIHNVEEGLFSTINKTYLYDDYNRWNSFGTINSIPRPENGWYEFLVMHQTVVNGTYRWWRFKQNVNPLTATWAQVNPSNVGTNVIRISSNIGAYGAGMYWFNDSKCPMCFANSSNGNWFGCGITAYHQGGIPGYNNEVVNGFQLVYMRTSKPQTKLFKKALLKANNIIEI